MNHHSSGRVAFRFVYAIVLVATLLWMAGGVALGQESSDNTADQQPAGAVPAPPTNLVAEDEPWDGGDRIHLTWSLSPDDESLVKNYRIYILKPGSEKYEPVDSVKPGVDFFVVKDLEKGKEYSFRLTASSESDAESSPASAGPVKPRMNWFEGERFWLLIITIVFCGSVVYWIYHARQGRPIKVRKIAGLEAVDEAVGRATEMGRSCLYIPGIQDINDIQTIASMTVLSRVAKTAAEYDAKVEVPTARSLVMTTAREAVQAAYLGAGRPDAYNQDLIYYVTDEQFGYVAYLQGMMVRDKPAACFYMGAFYAESLILAETGNSIGAIQVAGTAMPAQLPFFVAACDYTLIGEEFFAASAYLSGSAEELGSLKGQDVGKVIVGALVVLGVLLATVGNIIGSQNLLDWVAFLKDTVLT